MMAADGVRATVTPTKRSRNGAPNALNAKVKQACIEVREIFIFTDILSIAFYDLD